MMQEKNETCPTCGGTGEIGFFQGESRFLLTRDECPACCGLGYILPEDVNGPEPASTDDTGPGPVNT